MPLRRRAQSLGRALRGRYPRVTKTIACTVATAVLIVVAANAYMVLGTRGRSEGRPDEMRHAQTAIVLGALVHPDGRISAMLADRVRQAAALWRAEKVDRVLVSGDHGKWSYDEPDTMREALVRAGVPERVIFTDHAGFNTWATMFAPARSSACERHRDHPGVSHAAGALPRAIGRCSGPRADRRSAWLRRAGQEKRHA